METPHGVNDPNPSDQRKKVGEVLKDSLVTPGATDRIYEKIFDENIPANKPLTPQQREVVDSLDTRWESRKPSIDEAERISDPDMEAQAAKTARIAREKQEEEALKADLARRVELVKSTTITSAPPHQGSAELPRISKASAPQPQQELLTRLANLFRGKQR